MVPSVDVGITREVGRREGERRPHAAPGSFPAARRLHDDAVRARKTIVEAGDLKAAIRTYNIQQRRNPVSWQNHLDAMVAFEEQERQQLADEYAEEIAAAHREGVGALLRTASEAAQKFRNQVGDHLAGGVNLGASEKWG